MPATDEHDFTSAKCTVSIDDPLSSEPGSSALNPLTVADAKELAEKGKATIYGTEYTLKEGVNYYIKGRVSKLNSGIMAMFGDMDFGEMMGGSDSGMDFDDMMDDMDFDMDSMDDMGFDMSSMGFDLSSFFGSSDKVTYYISDDGTKENQLKVVNGLGTMTNNGGAVVYGKAPNLSPGDCVVVCGPLVYSEDTSMFSSLMGGSSSSEQPKKTAKVDELNYLAKYDPTLKIEDWEIYVNKTLDNSFLYSIDNYFDFFSNQIKITNDMEVTYKSSDEEIAKWDEDSKAIIGVNEGTAKITVKVKVILQAADDTADPKVEEKSYTMKRKFKLTVKTRDLDPAGYYDGDYVLTTKTSDLKDGTRLLLVGTRVKDDTNTDYVMGENNSMMGGGKSGSKITISGDRIPYEDVPNGTLEVVLEKVDDTFWYLNAGEDENGNKLYLYASVKAETEQTDPEGSGSGTGTGTGSGSGFNMDEMMEMFNPSAGLKVGTYEKGDSLKATITIANNIATIKFPKVTDDKNNTIMLSSAFDMDSMMNMFSSSSEEGGDEQGGEEQSSTSTPSFDMGSFDLFMASFNTKKPGDETPEEGKAAKNFLPRIYCFVPDESFDISIGSTDWRTIVTYKDVVVPEGVEAYIVNDVKDEGTETKAMLQTVEKLKGGKPYLLYASRGDYTLTLASDEVTAPTNNKLKKSDRTTTGSEGNSTVFVLAKKANGGGFYRWVGDELGAGRVYLPVDDNTAREFCGFLVDESSAIDDVEHSTLNIDHSVYDLQGRHVLNPSKGMYVLDGKKVVIK